MQLLNKIAVGIAGVSVLIMTLIGGLDVLGANLLNRPFPATYEATELLMVLAVMLAMSTLQARSMNISVDIFTARAGVSARYWLDIFALMLSLIFFGLIAWQGWVLAFDGVAVRESAQGVYPIPVYPFKIAFAAGASLMALQCGLNLIGAIRGEAVRPAPQESVG
jgi:TRAP-type C4-dicarboxylate transport system permease small subunit